MDDHASNKPCFSKVGPCTHVVFGHEKRSSFIPFLTGRGALWEIQRNGSWCWDRHHFRGLKTTLASRSLEHLIGPPPGMVWGSAVSTPRIFGRPWEAADFPFSDRPVLGVLTFELMSGAVEKFWQTLRWQSSNTDRDAYSHFPIRASRSCTTTIGVKTHSGRAATL